MAWHRMGKWLRAALERGDYPPHPRAGLWGRSTWKWHILGWAQEMDGSAIDGASLCGTYVGPPYYEGVASTMTCAACRKIRDRR